MKVYRFKGKKHIYPCLNHILYVKKNYKGLEDLEIEELIVIAINNVKGPA